MRRENASGTNAKEARKAILDNGSVKDQPK
jgi:hypothetical protein